MTLFSLHVVIQGLCLVNVLGTDFGDFFSFLWSQGPEIYPLLPGAAAAANWKI